MQLGSDLLFWYHYTQAFKQVILKDRYIPAFKYRQLKKATKKTKQSAAVSRSRISSTLLFLQAAYDASISPTARTRTIRVLRHLIRTYYMFIQTETT